MPFLPTLRTVRTLRIVTLLGYLLVVAATVATPWMQPAAYGSVCSTAGGNAERDATIGCALCLPTAAPPLCLPVVHAGHAAAGDWQPRTHQPRLDLQLAALPPARGPPAV